MSTRRSARQRRRSAISNSSRPRATDGRPRPGNGPTPFPGRGSRPGFARLARRWVNPDHSPFLYLLPTLLFIVVFLAYPVFEVVRGAFIHNVPIRPWEPKEFVGLGNFTELLTSSQFYAALRTTVAWTALAVAGKMFVGMTAALLLQREFVGRRIYLTLMMIPWVTPIVVAAVVWRWVLNSQYGQLNGLLDILGLPVVPWLGQSGTAFVATAVVDMWVGIPFVAMVLMAGLQSIPDELYEAATVDGAGIMQTFRLVTLPLLRPILFVVLLLTSVWTFNSFEVIFPMTRGGPAGATTTLVIETYRKAFGSFEFGQASALATLIFLILLMVSIFYWYRLARQR